MAHSGPRQERGRHTVTSDGMGCQYATQWRDATHRRIALPALVRKGARHAFLSWAGSMCRGPGNSPFLRCMYCHYVFDDQVEDFRRIMLALSRLGRFVDTDTAVAMVEGRSPIDGPCFHISFDDGFRNILTNAAPVLSELAIPGLVFVPTAFVGATMELAREYCVDIAKYSNPIEMMSWAGLETLVAAGWEVDSHTRRHVRCSEVSDDSACLSREVLGSKQDIEGHLGRECRYIAWPFGTQADIDQFSVELIREFGYRACFGAFRAPIKPGVTDLYQIPRHNFSPEWPLAHVRYFAAGNRERER